MRVCCSCQNKIFFLMADAPDSKKMKFDQHGASIVTCKHFVKRKKRFCKMTVAKGKEYCGEHDVTTALNSPEEGGNLRIPCPLDQKHTVYSFKLNKHLKICNARQMDQPKYIVPGINKLSDNEEENSDMRKVKLADIEENILNEIIDKVEYLYDVFIKDRIEEMFKEHHVLEAELSNREYGNETKKHLIQTSSILGCLSSLGLLRDKRSFIEFGAGKGQVSYWLARAINSHKYSNVLLIDRASHRHKKDNKLEDRDSVHRIRADIGDFEMRNLDLLQKTEGMVGVGKHLCGVATDLALRCIVKAQDKSDGVGAPIITEGFLIALCCHHRCEWNPFVGKKFFIDNNLSRKDFDLITRMVSWAICGNGLSREVRKDLDEKNQIPRDVDEAKGLTREQKQEIGLKCKRVLDYSRLKYMCDNGFNCSLKYYVKDNVTLENVCILGTLRNKVNDVAI